MSKDAMQSIMTNLIFTLTPMICWLSFDMWLAGVVFKFTTLLYYGSSALACLFKNFKPETDPADRWFNTGHDILIIVSLVFMGQLFWAATYLAAGVLYVIPYYRSATACEN